MRELSERALIRESSKRKSLDRTDLQTKIGNTRAPVRANDILSGITSGEIAISSKLKRTF